MQWRKSNQHKIYLSKAEMCSKQLLFTVSSHQSPQTSSDKATPRSVHQSLSLWPSLTSAGSPWKPWTDWVSLKGGMEVQVTVENWWENHNLSLDGVKIMASDHEKDTLSPKSMSGADNEQCARSPPRVRTIMLSERCWRIHHVPGCVETNSDANLDLEFGEFFPLYFT